MTITPLNLSRAAGLCAMLAGLLYIGIQFVHPPDTLTSVGTTAWVVVGGLTFLMAVFGLVGLTGIYLRQAGETGLLGLLGAFMLALFFLLTTAYVFTEVMILPLLGEAPSFVESFLGLFNGAGSGGTLGALEVLAPLAGGLYTVGGVLFGVATYRAKILPSWAAVLWAMGAVLPLLTPVVPHAVGRFAAVPVGVALVWLGYAVWSARRATASQASVG